jgi:hypothetical protein
MNLFAIAPNDQSVAFLGRIFGRVGSVLPVTDSSLLLATMFKSFNTVLLVLGAFLIVYTTVVGLLATAHEGEFMGKKWSGLWVPLRSVIGIAALFPTATGYSALQVIVMWIILQGVGAADMLWGTVLNYLQLAGSPFTSLSISQVATKTQLNSLFNNLTCQAAALKRDQIGEKPLYYCASPGADRAFCGSSEESQAALLLDFQRRSIPGPKDTFIYKMGPDGGCGVLTYSNPARPCRDKDASQNPFKNADALQCAAATGQIAALSQIIPTVLGKIASTYNAVDNDYVKFWNGPIAEDKKPPDWIQQFCDARGIKDCCVWKTKLGTFGVPLNVPCDQKAAFDAFPFRSDDTPAGLQSTGEKTVRGLYVPYVMGPYLGGKDYSNSVTDFYISTVSGAVTTAIASLRPDALSDWRKEAVNAGWIVAGAFYTKMADSNDNNLESAIPKLDVADASMNLTTSPMKDFRNNLIAAKLLPAALDPNSDVASSSTPPQMAQLSGDLNAVMGTVMSAWKGAMSSGSNNNPLGQLQSFGKGLLITAEVLYVVVVVGTLVIAGVLDINAIVLGTGVLGLGSIIKYLLLFGFLPLVFGILAFCITFGGLLAVYTPLIPYIMFTVTALGWLIYTIEAMVAAPLIALGILSPGGQHEILGRAEPAIMLLLGVLLRPCLMIFGLMIAMLLASVSVMFVNNTFLRAMSDITKYPSIIQMILFMAAYTFLIISVLNKCFALIHLLPERVMTWIGGQAVSYGEGEMMGEVKRGTEAAGASAASAARTGAKTAGAQLSKASAKYQKAAAKKGLTS